MKNIFVMTILMLALLLTLPTASFAQRMMGSPTSSPDNAAAQSQQQEEQEGKKFLDDLSNKTVICSQLKDADFEKIGEYFMGQAIGDTSRHIAMNGMMKGMMGEKGEGQMHIVMGKRMSKCESDAPAPANMMNMMGGSNSMMGSGNFGGLMGGFGILSLLFWIVALVNLILLGVWLWKQIRKK